MPRMWNTDANITGINNLSFGVSLNITYRMTVVAIAVLIWLASNAGRNTITYNNHAKFGVLRYFLKSAYLIINDVDAKKKKKLFPDKNEDKK